MSRPTLDPIETRVAGALAEKSLATPDHYPLTMNSLVAACNQKSSRDPVTEYSERDVNGAVERLMRRGLAGTTAGAGHRVVKVRHLLDRALDLSRRELAALTVLLLRGPQTPGEIKTRTNRLAEFASVGDVEEALWMLSDREQPLVMTLGREPGQSADRFAHLLSGDIEPSPPASTDESETSRDKPEASPSAPEAEEVGRATLAQRVAELEEMVSQMQREWAALRAEFE